MGPIEQRKEDKPNRLTGPLFYTYVYTHTQPSPPNLPDTDTHAPSYLFQFFVTNTRIVRFRIQCDSSQPNKTTSTSRVTISVRPPLEKSSFLLRSFPSPYLSTTLLFSLHAKHSYPSSPYVMSSRLLYKIVRLDTQDADECGWCRGYPTCRSHTCRDEVSRRRIRSDDNFQ